MWGSRKKKDPDRLVSEALGLLREGKGDAAAARLREATGINPAHAQAWYCLGTIHSQAGEETQAIECYRKSAEHAPAENLALPLYNMGNALQALGRLDEAVAAFRHATAADPGFADAWINLGRLLDDSGGHREAIECYDKALAEQPDDITALANRGNSLRALGRHDEARASYESALAIETDHPAARVGLGLCLGHLGRPDDGLAVLDECLDETYPLEAFAERAILLAMLGRHEEALAALDDAIGRGLRNPATYNNRGEILAKLGRTDDAIASFDEALALGPRYTPALFGKARTLCNTGRYGPARETIDHYFEHSDGSDGLQEPARAILMLCRNESAG